MIIYERPMKRSWKGLIQRLVNVYPHKREIPFNLSIQLCLWTALSLNLLTFSKPVSKITIARFLWRRPLLFVMTRVHKGWRSVLHSCVFDVHGCFFTQIKQGFCFINLKTCDVFSSKNKVKNHVSPTATL